MAGEQEELGNRLREFLFYLIGIPPDIGVGQEVLTRVGFGDLVGYIRQHVSPREWCQEAFEVFVEVYPNDTPQQLECFLVGLATTDLTSLVNLSPEDKTRLEKWRDEARGLSREELRRLLAPPKWVTPAVSFRPGEVSAQVNDERARQAAQAPASSIVLSARQVLPLLDLDNQVKAFTDAYPGYATGGIYQCVISGDSSAVENWLVPRLIATVMPKRIQPKAFWLTNTDLPAGNDSAPVLDLINQKLNRNLSQNLPALVRHGRGPALVLFKTNSLAARLGRLAGCCCADATLKELAEQARRNSVLLIIGWAAVAGEIEPADKAELCVIPLEDMERDVLGSKLRDCLEQLAVEEAEIDDVVTQWSSMVDGEIGTARQVYDATVIACGGL